MPGWRLRGLAGVCQAEAACLAGLTFSGAGAAVLSPTWMASSSARWLRGASASAAAAAWGSALASPFTAGGRAPPHCLQRSRVTTKITHDRPQLSHVTR